MDVSWASIVQATRSVQAYSPPLVQMTYYEMVGSVAVPVRTSMVSEDTPA